MTKKYFSLMYLELWLERTLSRMHESLIKISSIDYTNGEVWKWGTTSQLSGSKSHSIYTIYKYRRRYTYGEKKHVKHNKYGPENMHRTCRRRDRGTQFRYSRSWSEPSSDLSSLLFINGNFLLNEKFFFFRSNVDCWNQWIHCVRNRVL